jgi:hypothetical protein
LLNATQRRHDRINGEQIAQRTDRVQIAIARFVAMYHLVQRL